MGNVVRNNSFSIFEGQITGVFGLIGSGRTETFKIVSGIYKRDFLRGGEIELDGRPVRYRVPRAGGARRHRLRHRGPQERRLLRDHVDRRELYSAACWRPGRETRLVISMQEMRALVGRMDEDAQHQGDQRQCARRRAVRRQPAEGGDRQGAGPEAALVIFDEPTRGVDVGAIAEIHQLINRLADEGLAVVVISSYLPEIMNLSDRILVCRQGRIVEEFSPAEATEEKIMYAAVH